MKIFARFLPVILVVFFLFTHAFAKTPRSTVFHARPLMACDQSITLSSQAEVDAFTCTVIGGDLTISGSNITNLESLNSLKSIDGSLFIIGNAHLSSIDGLGQLTFVDGILEIRNNTQLINLDGLSSLVSVKIMYPGFTSITISDNPALISISGLKSLTSTPGTWQIENNASLPNLDGLSLTQIGSSDTRSVSLIINGNAVLANIDGLSALNSVGGYYFGMVDIENNPSLTNVNGLSSLTTISGGFNAGLTIINNVSLTNVDGLSSLTNIASSQGYIYIQDNPNLTSGCALFPILHNRKLTGFPLTVIISGNGAGFTEEEILAGGLCPASTIPNQPSHLLITDATSRSMRISFTPAVLIPSGYITLIRAYGSPYPVDAPVDGTAYHVGNTIGSSTVVVGVGQATSLTVTSLIPNTNYYFAIFAYDECNDYVTLNPLEGNRSTTNKTTPLPADPTVQASNLEFFDISCNSMVVSFKAPTEVVPDGYITFMRAVTSPSPEDVPISGTVNYHVGDVVGHSTVVVGFGPLTRFNIISLIPDMKYYFDVYAYQRPGENGPIFLISPIALSGSASTTFSNFTATAHSNTPYPNPFVEEITIPFTVKNENALVQIVIFDSMGRKIADITSERFEQGDHVVKWDRTDNYGSKVTPGVYKYRVFTSESKQGLHGTLLAK